MQERHKAVPASYLILKKDEKILLGRRINTGYYDGYYVVPSGHIESDELPMGGLIREAKEEIGITILPEDAKFVHALYRAKHDETGARVDYFFEVEKWHGEVVNNEPHKCDDLQWFSFDQFPQNMVRHVQHALECYQKGIMYSELPFNQKFVSPNRKK